MSAIASQILTSLACYVTHKDVDPDGIKFYWQVACRYPQPLGRFVVNATTAIDDKQSAIDAVWAEIGIVSIESVVPVPF